MEGRNNVAVPAKWSARSMDGHDPSRTGNVRERSASARTVRANHSDQIHGEAKMNATSRSNHAFSVGDASQLAVCRTAIYRNVRMLVRANAGQESHGSAIGESQKDAWFVCRRDLHSAAILLTLSELCGAKVRTSDAPTGGMPGLLVNFPV